MRLGIFGGTFDPIHCGHLVVAETARAELHLERVLFVPAAQPPHKEAQALSPWQDRLTMLQLALAENVDFEISLLELQRAGTSYTVDTLRALSQTPELARAEFYLIIGEDSLAAFHTWREPEAILELARLVVYPRIEAAAQNTSSASLRYHRLNAPVWGLSSSEIRRRVRDQLSVRYLVPEDVRKYIAEKKLYRQ